MTRKRRADAENNRQHVVDIARVAFGAEGLDLPVREVARRAGVAVATVYRHFPSRQDLVAAVLADQVTRCAEDMRAALSDPDSRRALTTAVRHFGESQIHDRGLVEALRGSHTTQRQAHAKAFAHLVHRAHTDGVLRPHLTVEDARLALTAIASARTLPAPAVRKLTDLLLAGVLREESA